MEALMWLFNTWKELVTKLITEYPPAAAIATLAAVGGWFLLEKEFNPKKPSLNAGIALGAWSVVVPLLGATMDLLVEAWRIFKTVCAAIANLTETLYHVHQRHPFLILCLVVAAVPVYFAWKHWRPHVLPRRALRIGALAVGVVVLAYALDPFLSALLREKALPPVAVEIGL